MPNKLRQSRHWILAISCARRPMKLGYPILRTTYLSLVVTSSRPPSTLPYAVVDQTPSQCKNCLPFLNFLLSCSAPSRRKTSDTSRAIGRPQGLISNGVTIVQCGSSYLTLHLNPALTLLFLTVQECWSSLRHCFCHLEVPNTNDGDFPTTGHMALPTP